MECSWASADFDHSSVSFSQEHFKAGNKIKIDTISLRKNWRTRDMIIMRELDIRPGDEVTVAQIQKAVSRLWNIGNFSKVSYSIDTLTNNRILLVITARDAITIMPDLSLRGNRNEYLVTAGVDDNNFLGRNISFGFAGSFGTNARYASVKVGIPRQMLYRNMAIRCGFLYGESQKLKYLNEKPVSGTAYLQNNFNFSIGNPWHSDYKYVFSPDLSVGFVSHKTDSTLLTQDVGWEGDYNAKFISVSVSESVGLMNRIRHQENGYIVYSSAGYGISLNKEIPGYFSLGIGARYSKLFNRIIQISANLSTGYTSCILPSFINYLGPDNVKGIITGERWGKSVWSANTSLRLTYLNRDWLAVENSFFVNAGDATDHYSDFFTRQPLISAGTGLKFMIPIVPWLSITFYYAFRGPSKNWYSMEF
jgi:outer membrane protein assembly factor BamA